ncbi:MAG: aspartyl/asparaginyl beta-hydroxylase domain-containing protein [Pseudomonadota bacterium]
MWFNGTHRTLGKIDLGDLPSALLRLPESAWLDGEYLRQQLTLARQTHSIFLHSLTTEAFEAAVQTRAIAPDDVEHMPPPEAIQTLITPILDEILHRVSPDGLIVRAQFARMHPGAAVKPHIDTSSLLTAAHRMHLPITSNDGVMFKINGEAVRMHPGQLYELNNRVHHSVINSGPTDRIHLIVDILPPEHNGGHVLKRGFELGRKQKAADRVSPPAPVRHNLQLPTVIATSVVRGTQKSQSHGGIYLVNMQTGTHKQVVDWNTCDISWEGRGWDRGLRGIEFYQDKIYVAASDELFCFDQDFKIVGAWRTPYLRHAHEICRHGSNLFVTSTGFDSVLQFNLDTQVFDKAWLIRPANDGKLGVAAYTPAQEGPDAKNRLHINSVFADETGIYVGARALPALLRIGPNGSGSVAKLPSGTHNAMPYAGGVVFNHTNEDVIAVSQNGAQTFLPVPTYPEAELENFELGDEKLARQGFGRGLCWTDDQILLTGSSPSTITAWDLPSRSIIASVTLSMDVRNAIHGLQIWPFDPI